MKVNYPIQYPMFDKILTALHDAVMNHPLVIKHYGDSVSGILVKPSIERVYVSFFNLRTTTFYTLRRTFDDNPIANWNNHNHNVLFEGGFTHVHCADLNEFLTFPEKFKIRNVKYEKGA